MIRRACATLATLDLAATSFVRVVYHSLADKPDEKKPVVEPYLAQEPSR